MISDENSRLRKIERELYVTDMKPPNKRSLLHDTPDNAPDDWAMPSSKNTMTKPSSLNATSIFKRLFGVALVFLLIACIVLGASLLSGNNTISGKNIELTITTKSFVDGGESLPVDVSIINKNKSQMELATLVLEYPEGSDADAGTIARVSRDLPTIGVGDSHQESFVVKLFGQEGSQKELSAHVEFRVPGSNAVYDKTVTATVVVRTSPVRLTLNAADSAIPNQEIPFKFTIVGNGVASLPDTALIAEYPEGFTFTRADPMPTAAQNTWYLGDLPPGVDRTITVYGTFSGGANDLRTMRASVGAQSKKNEQALDTTYNSVTKVVSLTNAFLSAKVVVGDATGATIPINATDRVRIRIPWSNTLSSQVTNAEIRVRLSGSAFDPAKVQVENGFFDTVKNEIVWTKQQEPGLGAIDPGRGGALGFSLVPKSFGSTSVSNPSISIAVDILGFQTGGTKLTANSVDVKKMVVNSDLNMITRTLFYGGQIQNSGPMPAKANKETTYTVDWQITNFRNKVSGVKVSTTLPVNVAWKDVVLPQSELGNIAYNEVTREVVWTIGDVSAGTGSNAPAKTVSFKVGITPSGDQVGTIPYLTGDILVTGTDSFTGSTIQLKKRGMTTQLLNDLSNVGASGKVVQ
jgi:hypothetical protein